MTAGVRVRFAPSPTGQLHIGGVRSALFNYLYAKTQGGKFFIRIEDTDEERSKREYEDEILAGFRWLGLDWDEPTLRQSDRFEKYKAKAEELIKSELAYRDPEGSSAVFLKVPKKIIKLFDVLHDPIEFDTNEFDDIVILKSSGNPTFHFACVFDDVDMQITHVIRGDDHLTNTARQLLIYEALGVKPPKFAHMPLILNEEGKPLSKREGGGSLGFYIEKGFLPEGILNYLALLGWGPGGNEEYFPKQKLIEKFSLKRVNKTAASLNVDKLRYLNGLHLRDLSQEDFETNVKVYFKREVEDKTTISEAVFLKCALLYQDRIKYFEEILRYGQYFFEDAITWDKELVEKYFNDEISPKIDSFNRGLDGVDFSSSDALESYLRGVAEKTGVKAADLIHPVRFAMTGSTVSPSVFDVMILLGKERVQKRIVEVLELSKEVA
jgi:glutamyl-tRNA synthetase